MAEINSFGLLTLFAITIVVGYAGSLIFHKTKIPDIIWLLIFGLLIGPVFSLVDRTLFLAISPFLAALALLIILFDAGLNIEFYSMVRGFSRGMFLAVFAVVLDVIVVAFASMRLLGFDLMTGAILGAIVGGTSSPVVLTLVNRLGVSKKTKTLLSLESVFNDPLVVVLAIALINISISGSISAAAQQGALSSILASFSIGAVIGTLLGVVWLNVLEMLRGKPFDYMLTLAALFLVYVFVESVSGSGAVAALAFGLVLGNGLTFSRILRTKRFSGVGRMMRTFQGEVSFFIRSFFFVYLGLIVDINRTYILYGVVLALILIITRLVAVQISTWRMDLSRYEKKVMHIMAPRGLAAAVLAQLTISYGLKEAEVISNIVFVIILVTVVYTAAMAALLSKRHESKGRKEGKVFKSVRQKEK